MSDAQDFHEKLMGAVRERLSAIAGNEEKLVEAWVAQHGFKPDECEIVRQMQNGTTRMWVAKRGEANSGDLQSLARMWSAAHDVRNFKAT
jgi:hypothetical protein